MVIIREAREAELSRINEIWKQSKDSDFDSSLFNIENSKCFVLADGDKPVVGFAQLYSGDGFPCKLCFLNAIAVDESHNGNRYSDQLWAECSKFLDSGTVVKAGTKLCNSAMQHILNRWGFTPPSSPDQQNNFVYQITISKSVLL